MQRQTLCRRMEQDAVRQNSTGLPLPFSHQHAVPHPNRSARYEVLLALVPCRGRAASVSAAPVVSFVVRLFCNLAAIRHFLEPPSVVWWSMFDVNFACGQAWVARRGPGPGSLQRTHNSERKRAKCPPSAPRMHHATAAAPLLHSTRAPTIQLCKCEVVPANLAMPRLRLWLPPIRASLPMPPSPSQAPPVLIERLPRGLMRDRR